MCINLWDHFHYTLSWEPFWLGRREGRKPERAWEHWVPIRRWKALKGMGENSYNKFPTNRITPSKETYWKREEHRPEGGYDPLWHCAWLSSLSEPDCCHRPQRMASTGPTMAHEIWGTTENNWSGPLPAIHSSRAFLALILLHKYLHPSSFSHSMPGESASSLWTWHEHSLSAGSCLR